MKFLGLIFRNVRRNPLRTSLTALGTMVLVFVVTLVWSLLAYLDAQMADKKSNFKAIVSERWRLPSQMPKAYARTLIHGAPRPGDPHAVRPLDYMTWSFYGGSLDPKKRTRENSLFAIAMEPQKVLTMLDEIDSLQGEERRQMAEIVARLEKSRQGLILGKDRLAAIGKRVGDRITITSINYKDIDLEFEIVGQFPPGRYDQAALMRIDYLNDKLDAYPRSHQGNPHPLADKSLNLVWLLVKDSQMFNALSEQITSSPEYKSPAVKVETLSSGVATFLEAYRDIFWGLRWLLCPAILATLSLIIANAISISVRERQTEFAIMKVLGYKPWQILTLVLGEAVLIGGLFGVLAAVGTWFAINHLLGGLKIPIAFFNAFYVNNSAWWWGLAVGGGTALAGSILPAWTACRVRVAQVFSRVA